MSRKCKNSVILLVVIFVFCIRIIRGLRVPGALSGELAGGAANAPIAVFVSAVFTGVIAWILLEAISRLISKIKSSEKR